MPLRPTWSRQLPKNTLETDDGVQAMERLKSRILGVVIGLTAATVLAQQAASSPPPAGFVAIVGDVERCDNYPVPSDSQLTVRQAVLNAGIVSDTVNVKVIRATQDRAQFSQVISSSSADGGEPVENGDVLLVQAMSPMKADVRKNAALRTDSGVIVVGLEEDGIKIGDVLLSAQTTPPADGQLKVIGRFQGQPPIAKAELYSPTKHGDVISISHDNRRVLKGFGNMAPSVSEWKHKSAALPSTPSSATSSYTGSDFSLSNVPSNLQSLELPAAPAAPMFLPGPGDDPPESNGFATDSKAESSTSTNALPISQSEDVSDIANETTVDGKFSFASDSAAIAPLAPAEIKTGVVTAAKSSSFNPWNLVFVGGLLLAGTLILAGTLRPDPDDNRQFLETAARESIANSRRSSSAPTATQSPVTSPIWQTAPKSELPDVKPEDVMKSPFASAAEEPEKSHDIKPTTSVTTTPVTTANSLVASHEWYGGDWNGRVVQSNAILNQTNVDADFGGDAQKIESTESNLTLENESNLSGIPTKIASQVEIEVPRLQASDERSSEIQSTSALMSSKTAGLSAADVMANDAAMMEIVSVIADTVARADDGATEIEDRSETLALEDLLQNRLPIDLCEAQLPLRIALF